MYASLYLFGDSGADGLDFHASELLTMAAQLLVVLALLELEDENLLALELLDDSCDHLGGSLAGSASTVSPSTTQMTGSSTSAPTSASSFSMLMRSPGATLYCLPPVFTIAYIHFSLCEITACDNFEAWP